MPTVDRHPGRLYLLLAGLILLLALFLRLRGLETTGLWGDQAFTLNTAMRWVNGGPVPLAANKSSVGFVNPPMIEYLYAAALRLWPDILSVSLLTLLGGLAAVAVTGAVTARLFGPRAGLWAMLAFAVAPWAVFWSQLIWNQTMVPPFATLALGGLLLYLAERPRAVYLIVAFAAAASMTQVHPGTAVQVVTIGLALLLFRRSVRWRHVAAGAAVFALLYVPYLLYQVGTGWADLRAVGEVAGEAARWSGAALLVSLDLIRAQGLFRDVPRTVLADGLAAALFVGAASLTALRGLASWRERRATPGRPGREWVAVTVVLLWFAMPLLFYLRSSVYLQNYYLVGQWPAHFILLGVGLDTGQRLAERWVASRAGVPAAAARLAGWVVVLPFVALAAFQVGFSLRYQDARAAGDGPQLQVRHARALIGTARDLLADNPACRLVAVGEGVQVETSNLALLQEFTDPGRALLADGALALPLPTPCGIFLDARPGSRASAWLATLAEPVPGAQVTVRDQTWQFYQRDAEPAAAPPLHRWDNGLALLGFLQEDPVPGRPMPLTLAWAVEADPPGDAYHFGTYLLAADGAVVGQNDGPGFDSAQWRPGDQFITWFELPVPSDLPAGTYRTAVAVYTWPDVVRVALSGGGDTAYLAPAEVAPAGE